MIVPKPLASVPGRLDISEHLVADLLSLEHSRGMVAVDSARLFPEYLAASEQLAHAVDTWRA